jgi:ABC-2 type transport system ATP-binding protein
MDEPTVGIDPQSRRRILDTVFRLRDEYSMTVLYTTHLMEEAQELSDRVAIIDHGEIIALGTQGELTQQVGEEDRLIFSIGEQSVDDALLRRIETEIDTVTSATYDALDFSPAPEANNGDDVDPLSTAELLALRTGQTQQGVITVKALRGRKALSHVITMLDAAGIEIQSVEVREPDLEAVFLHLTGRALRD